MTTYTWKTGTSTDWSTSDDWTPTGVPGSAIPNTDLAILGIGSQAYTVTIASGESYNLATLNIAGGTGGHNTNLDISGSVTASTLSYTFTGAQNNAAFVAVENGGVFDIAGTTASAITGTGTQGVTVATSSTASGGHLELGSTADFNSNVEFWFTQPSNVNASGPQNGEIEYLSGYSGGETISQDFGNLQWGSKIVFDGANFTGDTYSFSGKTLIVESGATTVLTMNDLNPAGGFNLGTAGVFQFSGDAINVVCFAAGTRILTAFGERQVESLMLGDIVLTRSGEELSAQPVKWLGRRRIDLAAHPWPETVVPVCIQRGAHADDVPHRDLLVSPDHAIYVDGKLISARQLINGTTIRQVNGLTSVEYFHVELDRHSILLAEGLPTESYLDTGNRGFFTNSGEPLVLHPDLTDEMDHPTREVASCAPFVWDADSVRPVWEALSERAAALGQRMPTLDTTTDPELCILAQGRTLRPQYAENGLYHFFLPKGAKEIRLVSLASSPTDVQPWLEDRRRLGVYVERIVLRSGHDVQEVPVDHPGLTQGWWAVERNGMALRRWTDGDAVLPLSVTDGPAILEIRATSSGMTYLSALLSGSLNRVSMEAFDA